MVAYMMHMNWRRFIYSALLYIVVPLVPLYLLWRARKQEEYAQGWSERFAIYRSYCSQKTSTASHRVWLHAVSLGETRAAKPLVDAFLHQYPDAHIILTHTTPTGRLSGQALFAQYLNTGQMTQLYAPYDLPDVVTRFLNCFSPTHCWLMETEIWPNIIAACVKRQIPISLINGRLSDKTLQKTLKNGFVARLFKVAYGQLSHVCAQSEADAMRYVQLGVTQSRLVVTGNVKFDMNLPLTQIEQGQRLKALAQPTPSSRRIVLLASTREGEEQMWLDALMSFDDGHIQWWLVPRHPQRFDAVEKLLSQGNFVGDEVLRKTDLLKFNNEAHQSERLQKARVVFGNTMGEMFAYYAVADVVLMGGAWQPLGGQNFLESLALGKPTIVGPNVFNFAQIAKDAIAADALIQVSDMATALGKLPDILNNALEYQEIQAHALDFVAQHQGAVHKTLDVLLI